MRERKRGSEGEEGRECGGGERDRERGKKGDNYISVGVRSTGDSLVLCTY